MKRTLYQCMSSRCGHVANREEVDTLLSEIEYLTNPACPKKRGGDYICLGRVIEIEQDIPDPPANKNEESDVRAKIRAKYPALPEEAVDLVEQDIRDGLMSLDEDTEEPEEVEQKLPPIPGGVEKRKAVSVIDIHHPKNYIRGKDGTATPHYSVKLTNGKEVFVPFGTWLVNYSDYQRYARLLKVLPRLTKLAAKSDPAKTTELLDYVGVED